MASRPRRQFPSGDRSRRPPPGRPPFRREELRRVQAVALFDTARVAGQVDLDALAGLDAALVGGIERAQRLDLVVEQLYAQRQLGGERVQVEDVAAQADFASGLDQRLAHVAEGDEAFEDVLEIDALADFERQETRVLDARVGHRLQQREHRRADDPRPRLGRASECLRDLDALAHVVGVRVCARAGEGLARREVRRPEPEGIEVVREQSRFDVGRCDRDPRTLRAAHERGEGEGLGAAPQAAGEHATLLPERVDQPLERGGAREWLEVERPGFRVRAHFPFPVSSCSSTNSASCAAQRSASLTVRPQALGKRSPSASAATRKARTWERPRSSSTR